MKKASKSTPARSMGLYRSSPRESLNRWRFRKVLITGGLGFIGSTLAIRLSEMGAQVSVVDSLLPHHGGNIFNLRGHEDKIRIHTADIIDSRVLPSLIEGSEFLFSLAGQTSHMDSMNDPHTDLNIDCSAQLNLLETCRIHNKDIRIVYASTRQIYGKPAYLPVDECHPISPVDINGIHKYSAESYYRLYDQIYGIRSCSLRLTNTIGPRMRIRDARQTFLGVWVKMLLEGQPIEVWGGQQLRDFNDVEDVVDAMLIAAQTDQAMGEVYNLGSEEVVSLRELAEMMIRLHGTGSLKVMNYPEERKAIDIGDYYTCFDKFRAQTGWKPTRSLQDTLKRTLDYYWDHYLQYVHADNAHGQQDGSPGTRKLSLAGCASLSKSRQ